MESTNYIPGTCNIGHAEIRRRRNGVVYSAVLVIAVIILLLMIDAGKIWRLALFIPAASFGVSFQQWYFKFCVNFGLRGVFNFGETGKTFAIEDKENLRKDRIKALKMIITGSVFGLFLAVIFYILPV